MTKREHEAFRDGIRCAAKFAGLFDNCANHPNRLEDMILYKFNIRRNKTRRKRPNG